MQHLHHTIPMILTGALIACGGQAIDNNATSSGSGAGGTSSVVTTSANGTGGDSTSVGGGGGEGGSVEIGEIDCAAVCAEGAPEGGCLAVEECQVFCNDGSPGWAQPVADAFETCALEEFLCFETMDGCIWSELYPKPFAHTIELTVSGLASLNGKTAVIAVEEANEIKVFGAVVQNGGFTISLPVTMHIDASHLVMMYIESNGDGQCSGADFVTSTSVPIAGDFLAPVFAINIDDSANPAPFVCDYL